VAETDAFEVLGTDDEVVGLGHKEASNPVQVKDALEMGDQKRR
jgi:hypothetical protein